VVRAVCHRALASISVMTHSFPAGLPRVALLSVGAAAVVVGVVKLRRKRRVAVREPLENEVVVEDGCEEDIRLVEQNGDNTRPSACAYGQAAWCLAGADSEEEQQLKQTVERFDSFDMAPASTTSPEQKEVQQPLQSAERFFIGSDTNGSDHEVSASMQRQAPQLFHIGSDLCEAPGCDSGAEAGIDAGARVRTPKVAPWPPVDQEAAALESSQEMDCIEMDETGTEEEACCLQVVENKTDDQEAAVRIQRWFCKLAQSRRMRSIEMDENAVEEEAYVQACTEGNKTNEQTESATPTSRLCIAQDGPDATLHDTQQASVSPSELAASSLTTISNGRSPNGSWARKETEALQKALKIVLSQEPAKESAANDTTQEKVLSNNPTRRLEAEGAKQLAGQSLERRDSSPELQMEEQREGEEPEKEAEPAQIMMEYTLEQLTNPKIWRELQVNPSERESLLPNSTFKDLFHMEKNAFRALPKWKRDIQKKKLGLF